MYVRQIVIGAILAVLVSSPGFALAQGRSRRMGMGDGMGHDKGSMKQIEPLMQQMGEIMQQMAERIKAGPLTPDQTLQLSTMMEQLATMITRLSRGSLGSETTTQLDGMLTRMTEMQQGLARLKVGPSTAAPALPQPAKP
jgi:hypothetical protein